MPNANYQLYVDNTLSLAETIVIKHSDAANALNVLVTTKLGKTAVDLNNPRSWKYYQNMSGAYHLTDTRMNIVSLDTLQVIEFNKTNLLAHPVTRKAYEYGQRHYRELVLTYPDQEQLIIGILYPCNIDDAVAAKDGTIMSYPSFLIEYNEYTFIDRLQEWIYNYLYRWVNVQYSISDDLYVASYIGQLHLHMVQIIFTLRLKACKTNEAHSFHVRQYLSSYSGLDKYLDKLTKKQILFFYRNILYIRKHGGSISTFTWLIDNLFTNRRLPTYSFTMRHDLKSMIDKNTNQLLSLYPDVAFSKKSISSVDFTTDKAHYSLEYIIEYIDRLTKDNEQYHKNNFTYIKNRLQDSSSNVVSTKLIQSYTVDYSTVSTYSLGDILFNHWANWSFTGKYQAIGTVVFPKNKITYTLTTLELFRLFIYTFYKSRNITLVSTPSLVISRLVRDPLPTVQELTSVVDGRKVSTSKINALINLMPTIGQVTSIDSFYSTCENIFKANNNLYLSTAIEEDQAARGYVEMCCRRLFHDTKIVDPNSNFNYTNWVNEKGFDFANYKDVDFYELAYVIMGAATGADKNIKTSVKDIQKAMASIMLKLSSYSILMSTDTVSEDYNISPSCSIRTGDKTNLENSINYSRGASSNINIINANESETLTIDLLKMLSYQEKSSEINLSKLDFTTRMNVVENNVNGTPDDPADTFAKGWSVDIR